MKSYILKSVSSEECEEWVEFLSNPNLSGGGGGQIFGKQLNELPMDQDDIPKVLRKMISFLQQNGKFKFKFKLKKKKV